MVQKPDNATPEKITNEARAWFIEIHYGEKTPDRQQRFEDWLAKDPRHPKSYNEVKDFMQKTEVFTSDPLCQKKYHDLLPEKLREPNSSAENIVAFKQPTREARQPTPKAPFYRRRFFLGSMAASIFLLLSVSVVSQYFLSANIYQTAIGEQKTVVLADGSTVKLNTNTKIDVDFSALNRSVTLEHGQAYFIVAKDRQRPFIVHFDKGTVTALGTEFDIYNKGPEVIVSLVEGTVKVHSLPSQPALTGKAPEIETAPEDIIMVAEDDRISGAQITLSAQNISPVIKTDNKLINAWQQKKMIFRDKTLAYILTEINRYSTQKIILGQPELADEVISGVFPTESSKALEIINKYFGFTATLNNRNEIILARAD